MTTNTDAMTMRECLEELLIREDAKNIRLSQRIRFFNSTYTQTPQAFLCRIIRERYASGQFSGYETDREWTIGQDGIYLIGASEPTFRFTAVEDVTPSAHEMFLDESLNELTLHRIFFRRRAKLRAKIRAAKAENDMDTVWNVEYELRMMRHAPSMRLNDAKEYAALAAKYPA